MSKLKLETIKLLPIEQQAAMRSLEIRHNCPAELSFLTTQGVMGFATMPLIKVDPMLFSDKPLGEYYLILLGPSGLKSTIMEEGCIPIERWRKGMVKKYNLAIGKYISDDLLYKASLKKPPLLMKPQPPLGDNFITDGGTINGIIDVLDLTPFLGVFNPDATSLLCNHSFRDPDMAAEWASKFCKLFSDETMGRLTGMSNVKIKDRAVTLVLYLQEKLAQEFLGNETFINIGLHNRILLANIEPFDTPPPNFDEAYLAQIKLSKADMEPFYERIEALLNTFESVQDTNYTKNKLLKIQMPNGRLLTELILDAMPTEEAAKPLLTKYLTDIRDLMMDSKYEDHREFLKRIHEHLFKHCAQWAKFEGCSEILLKHVECGIGVMNYFIEEKLGVTVASTDPIVIIAEKVIALFDKRGTNELHNSDIIRHCNAYRKINVDYRNKVLAHIEDSGNYMVEFVASSNGIKSAVVLRF